MSANTATVKIKLKIDESGSVKVLDRVGSASKKAGDTGSKSFNKMNSSAKAMTATLIKMGAAVGGLLLVKKAMDFADETIKLASDLEETQGKFDVVFRGMTTTAEAWSDRLGAAYAMSETESKKYLSSVQDLLVPTGMLRKDAGALSNEFVKMAADLGSFNNKETSEVIRDIQSALQGSSETMAKYGINVKAAKVEQEILNSGLASSKKEITDAHKAQAIYNIMMRDGADAVGDMERTSDSYANQLKNMNANVVDLKTRIGKELLPAMTGIINNTNSWFDENENFIEQDLPLYISNIATSLGAVARAFVWVAEKAAYSGEWWAEFFYGSNTLAGQQEAQLEAIGEALDQLGRRQSSLNVVLDKGGLNKAYTAKLTEELNRVNSEVIALEKQQSSLNKQYEETISRSEQLKKSVGEIKFPDQFAQSLEKFSAEAEKAKDAVEDTEKVIKAFNPYEISDSQRKKFLGFMSLDDQANAAQIMHDAAVSMAKDSAKQSESAADRVETAWTRAAENIQDAWAGFLTDVITGEFNGVDGLINDISQSLASSVSNNLVASITSSMSAGMPLFGGAVEPGTGATSSLMSGGFGAALSSINPWMLAGAVGLSAAGSLLGREDEPSYGEQLKDAIAPLVEELRKNTRALEISTQEMLTGADYSTQSIIDKFLSPGLLQDSLFKDRSALENIKIPTTTDRGAGVVSSGLWMGDYDQLEDMIAATPKELNSMFSTLFDEWKGSAADLFGLFQSFSEGDIEPLIRAMYDLPGAVEISETALTGIITELKSGATAERNQEIVGQYIDAFLEETKSQLKIESTGIGLEIQSAIESMAAGFDLDLGIDGFVTETTAYGDAIKSFNDTFGDENSGFAKQVPQILELVDAGILKLDDSVVSMLRNFDAATDKIKTGIDEFYAAAQANTLADMDADLAQYTNPLSGVEQAIANVVEQGEIYRDELIDNGMAIEAATQKTSEWTDAMTELVKAEMVNTAHRSLTIELLKAQGNEEAALAMQREDEINALRDTFGDLSGPLEAIKQKIYEIEDAARALSNVDVARSAYRSVVSTKLNEATEKQAALESSYSDAKSAYVTALNAKISAETAANQARIKSIDSSISSISNMVSETESMVDTFGNLVDTISDYRSDLLTQDNLIGVESRYKTAQSEFNAAIAGMYSSDSDIAAESIAKIPELSRNYLDLSQNVSGITGYQNDLAAVLTVLNTAESIAQVEKSNAEKQLDSLLAQQDSLERSASSLSNHTSSWQTLLNQVENDTADTRTFEEIQKDYLDAKDAFDNSSFATEIDFWQAELDRLDDIINTNISIEQAFDNYATALVSAIAGGYDDLAGSFKSELETLHATSLQADVISAPHASFAGGGTISGPSSGYNVVTQFHGKEHITPDSEMAGVKQELAELKEVMIEIRNTNGDQNLNGMKLLRLANKLTQGDDAVRTKEVA